MKKYKFDWHSYEAHVKHKHNASFITIPKVVVLDTI